MKITLIILLLSLFFGCTKPAQVAPVNGPLFEIKQTVRNKFPTVKQLSTNELAAWMNDAKREQPLLLDARKAEEFAVSHLHGAINADAEPQVAAALKNYPHDKPIVAYCSVGYRSSMLAEKLMQQGFTKVVNLEGSIFQWANEGQPVYKGEAQVRQVHPFDPQWGKLLKPELWSPLAK